MDKMQETMSKLRDVAGFVAVGAFTAQGEMLAEVTMGNSLNDLGAIANDVLLKSQQATDMMGVGRGNMLHIAAPKANVFARCLNENTDFAANEPGRAHVHVVLVCAPDANIGMAKMQLEKVIQEIAPMLR